MEERTRPGMSEIPPRTGTDRLVGRLLGDFAVMERIGSGGFGAIYRAEQTLLDREAVVKVMQAELSTQPGLVQRFLREARLATKLDHPYAAHVYAFGAEQDGILWIAMELVRGTPLDVLLKTQGPVPLVRFVPFLERVCEVVQAAHEKGIVHRDLKPANIMVLARSGKLLPKLLDFGIAKLAREDEAPGPFPVDPTVEFDSGRFDHISDATLDLALTAAESVQLTRQGAMIGSPHYMAPEQWLHAGEADARTDIYALAVLSYQVLTGHLPFEGSSIRKIAKRHARDPFPTLGPGFPEALHAVLARAAAKIPAERFASALELGAAVRAASGAPAERLAFRQLEEGLRAEAIAGFPQPIAEAVTLLDAARSMREAVDAAGSVVRAVIDYLMAVALACRARVGPGAAAESPLVLEGLGQLREGKCDEQGRLALTRELCRAFAYTRDAYPVPEWVAFFFEPGDRPASGALAAEALVRDWLPAARRAADSELAALWDGGIRELQTLLGQLGFAARYLLIVERQGAVESWMGARRGRKPPLQLQGKKLDPGEVALAGDQGEWVVSLSPLVSATPPTPGADAELFLLEGSGRHGARLVNPARQFERYDESVWAWLRSHVSALADDAHGAQAEATRPYRGLSSFTAKDSDNFFGREREAEAFANRLRMHSLLAVIGPSGSGKSSFVQAGVVPLLPSWRFITVRPGASPASALAARLDEEGVPGGLDLAERLASAARDREGVALVIDQFEELVTLCADVAERDAYAKALASAAGPIERPVRIIVTLRDDFLIRCQQIPALRERLSEGLQLLGTPGADDLARIITQPARGAGYAFDDPALVQEMVKAVADQPGALALLSFTAAQLWELRDRSFKVLTAKAYRALGGVGGALAQHAEATLAQMSAEERRMTREAFRSLVTAAGTRAVLTRQELVDILGGGAAAEGALERLIGGRLLVSERDAGGERIEVIHETLLVSWPRLVQWQREDAEGARLRDQLRAAARQWEERSRPRGVLWRGEALVEYRLWSARYPGALTESEKAFAAASVRDDSRGRRIRTSLLVIAFVILAAGLAVLGRANQRVTKSAREAKESLASMHAEQGRLSLLQGQPLQSLPFLARAYSEGIQSPAMRHMIARASHAASSQLLSLEGHTMQVTDALFSPDDQIIATAGREGTVRLWNASSGQSIGSPLTLPRALTAIDFSSDGGKLLTASLDGVARMWAIPSGQLLREFPGREGPANFALFSPDGAVVFTAGPDGDARLWNARTGEVLHRLAVPRGFGGRPAFSHNGRFVVTHGHTEDEGSDTSARVWDVETGALLWELRGHTAPVGAVWLSDDDRRLVTGSVDGTARIWDLQNGKTLAVLQGHRAALNRVALSPDGQWVATCSFDRTARLWRASDGKPVASLIGHSGAVREARFSPDSRWLATVSEDGTLRTWAADTGRLRMTFFGHSDPVWQVRYSHDGKRIATTSQDLSVKVWDAAASEDLFSVPSNGGCASFDPSGDRLYVDAANEALATWDTHSGRLLETRKWGRSTCTVLSPDGRLAYATGNGAAGPAQVWSVPEGAEVAGIGDGTFPTEHAAFDPQGRLLATGGTAPNAVALWALPGGKLVKTLERHADAVVALGWTADGTRLATGAYDAVADIWDPAQGQLLRVIRGHTGPINSVEFSRDGTRLLTASADVSAREWDVATGSETLRLEGHSGVVNTARYHPTQPFVVTASADGYVAIWDRASRQMIDRFPMGEPVKSAAFSPDGRQVVGSGASHAEVWALDLETRSPAEVERFVSCHVPFALEGARVVTNKIHRCAN